MIEFLIGLAILLLIIGFLWFVGISYHKLILIEESSFWFNAFTGLLILAMTGICIIACWAIVVGLMLLGGWIISLI